MKKAIVIVLVFLVGYVFACQCPITVLNRAECAKYEIIFRGKVLKVEDCNNKPGEAVFEVIDLYKGNSYQRFSVLFECQDPCAKIFQVGEEWIIYSSYKQINKAMMNWCSRSRKFISNIKEDYYAVTYGNSYDEEVKFLTDSLGLHRFLKEEPSTNPDRNQKPSMLQSVVLLLVSLVAVILFYYFFNKFFK